MSGFGFGVGEAIVVVGSMVVGGSLAMVGCPPQWYNGLEPRNHYTAGWSLATYIYSYTAAPLEHTDNAAAASQVQRGTQNTIARYV